MRRILTFLAVLVPASALTAAPALAAELWCMPQTICRADGSCHATTDEETSLRLADMEADATTMRAHAETVAMTRSTAAGAVAWSGTNAQGDAEVVIWTKADTAFTYTQTQKSGDVWKSVGTCEVQ